MTGRVLRNTHPTPLRLSPSAGLDHCPCLFSSERGDDGAGTETPHAPEISNGNNSAVAAHYWSTRDNTGVERSERARVPSTGAEE